jgi:DNA helicase IV
MFRLPVYQELSKEQDIITNLPLQGRYVVVGPPGTGKTVVALYRAELWKSKDTDSLFLVYNQTLNQYLNVAIQEKNLGDQTCTYNSWFWKWYKENLGHTVPQFAPYVYDWNTILREIGQKGSGLKRIKNIIVDEGQDFPTQFYTVLALIADNITIFADENQRITETNSTVQEIKNALAVKKAYTLSRNYRNTRPIAEFAAQFYAGLRSGVAEFPSRNGPLPYLVMNQDLESQITMIAQYAIANKNKQIGVFVKDQTKQYRLYRGLKEKNGELPVQMYQHNKSQYKTVNFRTEGIFVLCYPSIKGLEFDTVFHPDPQEWRTDGNPDLDKMKLYVLASRARSELVIISQDNNVPFVMQHVPQNLYTMRNVHVNQNN